MVYYFSENFVKVLAVLHNISCGLYDLGEGIKVIIFLRICSNCFQIQVFYILDIKVLKIKIKKQFITRLCCMKKGNMFDKIIIYKNNDFN